MAHDTNEAPIDPKVREWQAQRKAENEQAEREINQERGNE